ncbi:MAG TPA: hypothetical protein VFU55_00405 [Terracidiphilus sp.]|nr:hypothetical protein [Terracidiphilus sp.]
MALTDLRRRLCLPPIWSLIVALLIGGGSFSWALMRLGINIESPQLIHYVLLASPGLGILQVVIAMFWTDLPWIRVIAQGMWCGLAMWVPLEAITYVAVSWSLRSWSLFSFNNLPLLLVLLICWSLVIALISGLSSIAVRKVLKLGEQVRNPH